MHRPSKSMKRISSAFVFTLISSIAFSANPASADLTITDGQTAVISGDSLSNLASNSFLNSTVTLNQLTLNNSSNLFVCGTVYNIRNSDVLDLSATYLSTTLGGKIQQDLNNMSSRVSNFSYSASANYRAWCLGPTVNPFYFARQGTVQITVNGSAYSFFIVGPNSVIIASSASLASGGNSPAPLPFLLVERPAKIKRSGEVFTCEAGSYQYGVAGQQSKVSLTGASYSLKTDGTVIDTKSSDTGSYSWNKKDVKASGLITCEVSLKGVPEKDTSDWDRKLFNDGVAEQRKANAIALDKRGKAYETASFINSKDKRAAYARADVARVKILEERSNVIAQISSRAKAGSSTTEEFNSALTAQKKAFAAKLDANMEALKAAVAAANKAKVDAFEAADKQLAADRKTALMALSAKLEAAGYGFYLN